MQTPIDGTSFGLKIHGSRVLVIRSGPDDPDGCRRIHPVDVSRRGIMDLPLLAEGEIERRVTFEPGRSCPFKVYDGVYPCAFHLLGDSLVFPTEQSSHSRPVLHILELM